MLVSWNDWDFDQTPGVPISHSNFFKIQICGYLLLDSEYLVVKTFDVVRQKPKNSVDFEIRPNQVPLTLVEWSLMKNLNNLTLSY